MPLKFLLFVFNVYEVRLLILVASIITCSGFVVSSVGVADVGKEVTDAVVTEVPVQGWPWNEAVRWVKRVSCLSSCQFQGLPLPGVHAGVDGFPGNTSASRASGASVLGFGSTYNAVHEVHNLFGLVGVSLKA